jgi:hypothetical protein
MTTDCIDNLADATRAAGRGEIHITATEWGLVAILAIGFLLMVPAAALLISHLTA